MVSIGTVWDSTLDAARGRAAMIAPIALAAFFVPGVVQNAITAFGSGHAASVLLVVVVIATVLLTLWGQLAIIAIVTDPATTRAEATAQATRRFGAAIAIAAALLAIVLVALIPMFAVTATSGIDFAALQGPRVNPAVAFADASRGAVLFVFLYLLGFLLFSLWLSARVMLAYAVALNERRGIGAIARAIALTRGMTVKLIGVLVLYGIVLLVAMFAAQAIVLIPLRLIVGEANAGIAVFAGAIAGGLVSAALVALFCVFTGRLYVAVAGLPVGKDDLSPA